MLTIDEARSLTAKILSYSQFPECELTLSSENKMFTRFAANGITTSGATLVHSASITSSREGRSGSTTLAEFDDASLRSAVRLTEEAASLSPLTPESMPSLPPQKYGSHERYFPAPDVGHA